MSSVLEALRRMEEDEDNGVVATAGNETAPDRRKAWQWLLPLVVIVAGTAGAMGGFYLAHSPEPAVMSMEEPANEIPVFRVVAPDIPVAKKPEQKNSTSPEVTPPWVVETPAAEKTPVSEPAQTKIIEEAIPSEPAPQTQAQPKVAEASPAEKAPPEPVEALKNLAAADASAFKLQGVRWSETPSRRIAVINNQILREGAMVDNAKILTITADGVVLQVDGSRRFLAFSGR